VGPVLRHVLGLIPLGPSLLIPDEESNIFRQQGVVVANSTAMKGVYEEEGSDFGDSLEEVPDDQILLKHFQKQRHKIIRN